MQLALGALIHVLPCFEEILLPKEQNTDLGPIRHE